MDTKALFKIGYGLYVLTVNENGKDNGCIINTVMQVTSNPAQIAVAVNKKNYTLIFLDISVNGVAINILVTVYDIRLICNR